MAGKCFFGNQTFFFPVCGRALFSVFFRRTSERSCASNPSSMNEGLPTMRTVSSGSR